MIMTAFLWKGKRATSLLALIRARITHNNVWIRVLQLAEVSPGMSSMREIQTMSNPFTGNSDLEIDSFFNEILDDAEPKNNSLMTGAKSTVDSPEMQDGVAEFEADNIESEMGDTEIVRHPLKRKARTGSQGSQGERNDFGRHLHI